VIPAPCSPAECVHTVARSRSGHACHGVLRARSASRRWGSIQQDCLLPSRKRLDRDSSTAGQSRLSYRPPIHQRYRIAHAAQAPGHRPDLPSSSGRALGNLREECSGSKPPGSRKDAPRNQAIRRPAGRSDLGWIPPLGDGRECGANSHIGRTVFAGVPHHPKRNDPAR